MFLWPATNDFRLRLQSPLVNAGDNVHISGYTTDLALAQRIQQSTVDVGAYEMDASGTVVHLLASPATQRVCQNDTATFKVALLSGSSGFSWEYNIGTGWNSFSGTDGIVTGPPLGTYRLSSNAGSSTAHDSRW